ncbi:inorganic phosphate transporter-like protein pho88 [Xylona heveae TC161]|uniref:Inorganic phosphate transporter-like protein pho88 n=1 Tax=Xylona heveae (strain CBS 132557 / TC161) TaxID=1328760 RepID=A0A165AIG1_XYLHT|nr:inorganic phosphate transporter-like protein pho88 [Xylona heveae TC161]KZF20534.1 inorganic phosphate transporter-like protein pho88 [Xylona heveae TC161]
MAVSPQITNIVVVLFVMQVSKKIDFNDPTILLSVRALYLISNLIIAGLYLYVQSVINKKNDLTTLEYVEPAAPGSGESAKPVSTTFKGYDLQQLRSLFKGQLMGVGMMAVMHFYFKYTNPLLIQSILPLKSAFESNLVKIHIFGQPAAGDLKRPWKAGGGLMGALAGGQGPTTDKKSLEEAQKNYRGGAKEE